MHSAVVKPVAVLALKSSNLIFTPEGETISLCENAIIAVYTSWSSNMTILAVHTSRSSVLIFTPEGETNILRLLCTLLPAWFMQKRSHHIIY